MLLRCRLTLVAWLLVLAAAPAPATEPKRTAENVIVVTLDGLRWQEVFGGADESFIDAKQGGVKDIAGLRKKYLRDTAKERREALMPFFWGTVATKGQVFGNPAKGAAAKLTNGMKFSYPGYNELFSGAADPRITSNAKRENPNLTVLEFLNKRPRFQGKVEAICTWDTFPAIFRTKSSGLPVRAAWEPLREEALTEREKMYNDLLETLPRYWPGTCFDVFAFEATWSALHRRRPRVLYIGLGETDEWGHGRRYDLYLDAANKADRFLAQLWDWLQKEPQYQGKTALLITTDHGRGKTRVDWTDHGIFVEGAEFIWIGVMGPDTPALGEREKIEVTQSQVAATIASLVGEDFQSANPKAAPPLPVFKAD